MRNLLNKFRGAKLTKAKFFKHTELFTDLLEAIRYINPSASDEQIMFMATTTLLAITDTTALTKAVNIATNEAIKKAKEVSDLNDMFNAPTTTENNN